MTGRLKDRDLKSASARKDRGPAAQDGAVSVLLLLLTPALLGLAGLVLDGGTALAARQHGADLAEQAARAGADQLNTSSLRDSGVGSIDPAQVTAAACRYVHTVEPGAGCLATVLMTGPATATGTAGQAGQEVQVRIRTTSPTILLGLIGVNRLHTNSVGTATALVGIRTASLPAPPSASVLLRPAAGHTAEGHGSDR